MTNQGALEKMKETREQRKIKKEQSKMVNKEVILFAGFHDLGEMKREQG